jgi:putative glutathione S-transferase
MDPAPGDHARPRVASPLDYETYGDYAPPPVAYGRAGDVTTLRHEFDGRISDDGSTPFPADAGRYHLYGTLFCPWAQRAAITLRLRGLDPVVSSSVVDPVRDGRGWAFREGDGFGPDPVNGFAFLSEAYDATDPDFAGHVSVPVLWDRVTGAIVSNNRGMITHDLGTKFRAFADPSVDLYPEARLTELQELHDAIVPTLSGAVYTTVAARTQAEYDAVSDAVFSTLDRFEARLGSQRYLLGDHITDVDILLYAQLVRFDIVTVTIARLNLRRIVDYPNLWGYARDLHQHPAFRECTNFHHVRIGTYHTRLGRNEERIVPAGPREDWDAPHDRAHPVES